MSREGLAPFHMYHRELISAIESGQICLLQLVLEKMEEAEQLSKSEIGNTPAFNGLPLIRYVAETGNDALFQWVADVGYGSADLGVMTEARAIVMEKASANSDESYNKTISLIHMLREKHRLTGRYYAMLHLYLLYLPVTVISTVAAILSFLATALSEEAASKTMLAVGALSIFAVFLQTTNDQLQLSGKGLQHTTAADELSKILTDLEFGYISRKDMQNIKEQVHSIGKTCRHQIHSTMQSLFDDLVGEVTQMRENASLEVGYSMSSLEAADRRKADINAVASAISNDTFWPWQLRTQAIKRAVMAELRVDTLRLLSAQRSQAAVDKLAADVNIDVYALLKQLYTIKAQACSSLPQTVLSPSSPSKAANVYSPRSKMMTMMSQGVGGGSAGSAATPSSKKGSMHDLL